MSASDPKDKWGELEELRRRTAELERELATPPAHWQAREFYTTYYATTGFMLGMFGAVTSLAVNVVGSALVGQYPLKLIQVYLTFPLGEKALTLDGGLALTLGCCLYIATGMLLGIPFHLLLAYFTSQSTLLGRLLVASILAASMWLVHFYGILSWLQPLLFEGDWIVTLIPWYVGALTHLVYGWTMAIVYPLGVYVPYRRVSEQA